MGVRVVIMDVAVELALKEEQIKNQQKVVPKKTALVKGVGAIVVGVHLEDDEAVVAVELVLVLEKSPMERTKDSQMSPTMRAVLEEFTMTQRNGSVGFRVERAKLRSGDNKHISV